MVTTRFCQGLKGAVGATLCQNEADVKIHMEIHHLTSSTDVGVNIHLKDCFSLILAEGRTNCSF